MPVWTRSPSSTHDGSPLATCLAMRRTTGANSATQLEARGAKLLAPLPFEMRMKAPAARYIEQPVAVL